MLSRAARRLEGISLGDAVLLCGVVYAVVMLSLLGIGLLLAWLT